MVASKGLLRVMPGEKDLTVAESIPSILLVAALAALLGSWFLLQRKKPGRARVGGDGVQEATVIVKGRYRPETVVVKRGVPARLLFDRREDDPCSERVVFSGFQQEHWLPPFATTPIQFIPTHSGQFLFTCAMGMYQGRLIVEEPSRSLGLSLHRRQEVP